MKGLAFGLSTLLRFGTLIGAVGCGLLGEEDKEGSSKDAIEGDYWWAGARVTYADDDIWGRRSRLTGLIVHKTRATLARSGSSYVLTLPECENGALLTRSHSSDRMLFASNVECVITDAGSALGYKSWTIPTLRIDLNRRALDYRLCVTNVSDETKCSQDTAVFVPMGNADGRGGSAGSDGTSDLVNFANSERAWQVDHEKSRSVACAELEPTGVDCIEGLQRIRTEGRNGTLYRMKDGRFYLGGYDCYLPSDSYDGDPIRCGDSFEGMTDVGIPTMWIYNFSFDGEALHFEAEMHAQESTYWYILDGAVVPL
jgi:hypothetical protein